MGQSPVEHQKQRPSEPETMGANPGGQHSRGGTAGGEVGGATDRAVRCIGCQRREGEKPQFPPSMLVWTPEQTPGRSPRQGVHHRRRSLAHR